MTEQNVMSRLNAVNKRLYGTTSSAEMLKRYKRCVVFDKRSRLFVISASSVSSSDSQRKLFSYVRFLIKQLPELRMIRKANVVIKKTGKRVYVASCDVAIEFRQNM